MRCVGPITLQNHYLIIASIKVTAANILMPDSRQKIRAFIESILDQVRDVLQTYRGLKILEYENSLSLWIK